MGDSILGFTLHAILWLVSSSYHSLFDGSPLSQSAGLGLIGIAAVAMQAPRTTVLPKPRYDSDWSVERALRERRSVREFSNAGLSLDDVSQLLWAAQGITSTEGFRTAPSAGALHPLEVYIVVGNVKGLSPGVYRYLPSGHKLLLIAQVDKRDKLAAAAHGQGWVKRNAALLVFSAIEKRTTWKYGRRGIRYIHIEVGHAAQNVFLQAVALGLSAVVVGAFDDERVGQIMNMDTGERALYLMPVGRR